MKKPSEDSLSTKDYLNGTTCIAACSLVNFSIFVVVWIIWISLMFYEGFADHSSSSTSSTCDYDRLTTLYKVVGGLLAGLLAVVVGFLLYSVIFFRKTKEEIDDIHGTTGTIGTTVTTNTQDDKRSLAKELRDNTKSHKNITDGILFRIFSITLYIAILILLSLIVPTITNEDCDIVGIRYTRPFILLGLMVLLIILDIMGLIAATISCCKKKGEDEEAK